MPAEQIALYVVGFALFVAAATYASFVSNLLRARIQRLRYELREPSQLPPFLRELFAPAIKELEAAGFRISHCLFSTDFLIHERSERWALILLDPVQRVYAEIALASHIAEMPGFEVTFSSYLRGGRILQTVNGREHCFAGPLPGVILNDAYAPGLAAQLDSHRQHLRHYAEEGSAVLLDPKAYCACQQRIMDGHVSLLIREKALISSGENAFRLRFGRAVRMAWRFFRGERKRMRAAQSSRTSAKQYSPATNSDVPLAAEVESYLRLDALQERQPHSLGAKLILFVITFVMAYFAFGVMFSFENIVIFLGVLLLHELGHLAAMHMFKYRDLQVLFIPFLGAAAVGKNEHASAWKQIVVYLMGPLPGIVLGMILLALNALEPRAWLFDAAIIMLVLNYLNLLPFEPLDGGHILRIAVLERFPLAKLTFSAISVAALAAGAWYFDEAVLWILTFVMLAGLPMQWQQARLFRELSRDEGRDPDAKSRPGILAHIFSVLRGKPYRAISFAHKFQMAKAWEGRLLSPPPGLAASVGLFAIYAAIVAAPPAAFMGLLGSDLSPTLVASFAGSGIAKPDWRTELANAATEEQRWKVSLSAIEENAVLGRLDDARYFIETAKSLAAAFPADDLRWAELWETEARFHAATENWTTAAQKIQRAIELRSRNHQDDFILVHNIEQLAHFGKKLGKDLVESTYQTNLRRLSEEPDQHNWHLKYRLVDGLARHYYDGQRWEEAADLMQQRLELFERFNPQDPIMTAEIEGDLAWYYYRNRKWLDSEAHLVRAIVLLREAEKRGEDKTFIATEKVAYHLDLATLYLAMKQPTQALVEINKADTLLRDLQYGMIDDYLQRNVPEFDLERKTAGDRYAERAHAHAATLEAVRQLVADL